MSTRLLTWIGALLGMALTASMILLGFAAIADLETTAASNAHIALWVLWVVAVLHVLGSLVYITSLLRLTKRIRETPLVPIRPLATGLVGFAIPLLVLWRLLKRPISLPHG
ncbi:hypothetical protein A2886_03340 [candidate division WWE3 bacterium RIFCSPHIGHO2_01_FULL_42_13]|uniref:Uncharacterized protein n=1 Tax=candidate division WWE3 bacterium RIFCSPHIGHO2_01_FULL_42_13 TaxID=1802617 RepID=A0A1F4USS5_UNCKA|nr:MAG: hypothetical protein A2886_03340 [candidate division WWE3 bacterium RIFCSPHIGHO2_01_FULL_42_13]